MQERYFYPALTVCSWLQKANDLISLVPNKCQLENEGRLCDPKFSKSEITVIVFYL